MGLFGESNGLRSTVSDDEFGGFRVVIPVAPNWFARLFLPVWLCGWAVGEFGVTWKLISNGLTSVGPQAVFLVLWLTFWTIGGFFAFVALAWNWVGREVILFSDKWVELRREIGPFSKSKTFEREKIRRLRYSPQPYDRYAMRPSRGHMLRSLGVGGGTVAFDYESNSPMFLDTLRFGDDLSEIEARRLILTIQQRFKFPEEPELEPLPIQY